MNIIKGLKKITPSPIKRFVRAKLNHLIAKVKAPRIVWGYQDSNGEWRPRTRISDTVFMYHPERIKIEDNVFVWHYSILDGTGGLEIGEGTQVGAWVGIFTHSSHIAIRIYGNHYQEVPEQEKKAYPISSVKIGKYVFVGAGAKILPGVAIGKGALVAAGSVVSKDVGEFEIVSGNPAEVIGDTRKLDRRYLKDPQLMEWYNEWQKK
jgi:acetyltransferase-like isoleucine patch superfamily enzyme